jgi:DNA-binding NarL/FixJ family response regulator
MFNVYHFLKQNQNTIQYNTIQYNTQHFKKISLSRREEEEEVAILLIKAITYKIISEELYISIPTVKTNTRAIYKNVA